MKTIALIGCGRILNRHIEAIAANPGLEIALVCDKDEAKARAAAERLGVPFLTNYRQIRGVDIVAVLTPSGLHPRHVSNVAELTDAAYIVCEKPLSLTLREAYEVYRRVHKAGKVLLPVYQNRYNPLVAHVKELIDSGRLGAIHQFICNVLWNRNNDYFKIDWHGTAEFDGGVLYTQASHYVDMLHHFFGEVESHKGEGGALRGLQVFDSVSAVLRFRSGTVGTLNATVDVYEKNFATEFTLIAEKGTIRLSGTNLNQIDFWNVQGLEKPDMDFKLDHQYGKGHDTLYKYIVEEQWDMFPSKEDVLSGIRLMEMLSY
ncbi:MAG: Gfo/Idh/MocA family oxidoreductase [Kiritimatiellae bacterium]|jgi:UDP-N-acetyl-2-amino-2-deoxyglucuronate dehydrogenase|nr:Gfo/Idh/MocA family oxidoreductase [Kiritimatiellia bacterium]MDD4340703.1 Gfo/Idh/MocA family oxidoreductase [Kiritimatiellia bacterium]MDY0149698.1 Gfo/Idh/MocA family oxidoreductase [Kiritimatiellia bacterium]